MEFRIKDMYRFLLSHTFPGLLLGIEIVYGLKWFNYVDLFSPLIASVKQGITGNIIALVVVAYAFSTLLGFILDGIHHFLYEDSVFSKKLFKKIMLVKTSDEVTDEPNYYKAISDNISLEVYRNLEDDLYYPYEAYANISVAMIPGLILLVFFLFSILRLQVFSFGFWIPVVIYVFVLRIMIVEAFDTYDDYEEAQKNFFEAFQGRSQAKQ